MKKLLLCFVILGCFFIVISTLATAEGTKELLGGDRNPTFSIKVTTSVDNCQWACHTWGSQEHPFTDCELWCHSISKDQINDVKVEVTPKNTYNTNVPLKLALAFDTGEDRTVSVINPPIGSAKITRSSKNGDATDYGYQEEYQKDVTFKSLNDVQTIYAQFRGTDFMIIFRIIYTAHEEDSSRGYLENWDILDVTESPECITDSDCSEYENKCVQRRLNCPFKTCSRYVGVEYPRKKTTSAVTTQPTTQPTQPQQYYPPQENYNQPSGGGGFATLSGIIIIGGIILLFLILLKLGKNKSKESRHKKK